MSRLGYEIKWPLMTWKVGADMEELLTCVKIPLVRETEGNGRTKFFKGGMIMD